LRCAALGKIFPFLRMGYIARYRMHTCLQQWGRKSTYMLSISIINTNKSQVLKTQILRTSMTAG